MPFYDLDVDGQPSPTPKTELRLVQLPPAQESDVRARTLAVLGGLFAPATNFRCEDHFGWSDLEGGVPDELATVDADITTDLASIPAFLWGIVPSYGPHTMCAVLHDVRCDRAATLRKGGNPRAAAHERRMADDQFRLTLERHARTGPTTRWVMWSAVRLFGFLPLGAVVVLSVLVATLHYASTTFTTISSVLQGVTIWPWLRPLDVIPRGVSAGLSWCATQLAGSQPFGAIAAGLTVIAVALLLWRCVETVDGTTSFSWPGLLGLAGAVVVGVLALPPLLPLAVVTLVTRVVLGVLDLLTFALDWVRVRLGLASAADKAEPPRRPTVPGLPLQP